MCVGGGGGEGVGESGWGCEQVYESVWGVRGWGRVGGDVHEQVYESVRVG